MMYIYNIYIYNIIYIIYIYITANIHWSDFLFLDGPAPWHHGAEDAESQGPQGADVPKESDDANAAQGAREADAAEQPGQTGPLEPHEEMGWNATRMSI